MLLQSKFETYLLDDEHEESVEETFEQENVEHERTSFPQGFFSSL